MRHKTRKSDTQAKSKCLAGGYRCATMYISPILTQDTGIFIYPGYEFKVIDGLITNFHLPESTLIMLVSAFLGREKTLHAYEVAVKERYRFFSFGDAMYISDIK